MHPLLRFWANTSLVLVLIIAPLAAFERKASSSDPRRSPSELEARAPAASHTYAPGDRSVDIAFKTVYDNEAQFPSDQF